MRIRSTTNIETAYYLAGFIRLRNLDFVWRPSVTLPVKRLIWRLTSVRLVRKSPFVYLYPIPMHLAVKYCFLQVVGYDVFFLPILSSVSAVAIQWQIQKVCFGCCREAYVEKRFTKFKNKTSDSNVPE